MDSEKRNFILFGVMMVAILFGWNYFSGDKKPPQEQGAEQHNASLPSVDENLVPEVKKTPITKNEILNEGQRIVIENNRLKGSLSLKGARFDDLTLKNYKQTLSPESKDVELLAPEKTDTAYYVDFGWVETSGKHPLPQANTVWYTNESKLIPGSSIKLSWHNGKGLLFERMISLDENFMFFVEEKVHNSGTDAVTLYPYGRISRTPPVKVEDTYVIHEGPMGFLEEKLQEISYKDLLKDGKESFKSKGGWFGFSDKYWLTSLSPVNNPGFNATFRTLESANEKKVQVDYIGEGLNLKPGESKSYSTRFFAGAKVLELLDDYDKLDSIPRFDRAVDFGALYFITKPLYLTLKVIYDFIGNYGIAIILLTLLVRLLLFPLANKSFKSMSRMKELAPKFQNLKEVYAGDKVKLQQETMSLYKKHKVNPMSGCLPIVLQIPIFFALYKVLYVSIDLRHAPFFGWIQDLSAPDPTTIFNLFGLIPWTPPSFLMIGVFPLLMGLTMLLQQRLNPQPVDPIQAKIFLLMPIVFTYILASFPAGLVLYWTCSNLFSIMQQWVIMKNSKKQAPAFSKKRKK